MSDLKPCPLCGGEAKEFTGEDAAPHRWTVECDSCGAHVGSDTRHKARAKWNRRVERTCRIVSYIDESPASYGGRVHRCSVCRKALPKALFRNGWTMLDHCPRCGSRVVGVDDR